MKLSEAIDALAIATRADGGTIRTVGAYREKLARLVEFLDDVAVEGITVNDLRRFVTSQWDKGFSPFTVKTRVRAFKRLFNFLETEGLIDENPGERIKTPNPKRDEPKAIQFDDFVALLKTTEGGSVLDLRDRAVIMFLFDTGCRVGGLCGLEIDDLDLARQRAKVREKGNKTRLVFFMPETAHALSSWLEVRPQDRGDHLFVSFKGKCKGLTVSGVRHLLEARAARAGCTGPVNPHAFRHGFAKGYLMGGGDLATLSDILGHSTVAVTAEYYTIWTVDELQEKHGRHSPITRLGGCEDGE